MTAPTTLTIDDLRTISGLDLGAGAWHEITQEMIDRFAEATGDLQWIHTDPARAAEGPFGRTIAHGYLTLSLLPTMLRELLHVRAGMEVNYGIDRLRLTSPVPSGSSVRMRATLLDAEGKANGVLYRVEAAIEIEEADRPALSGVFLFVVYP